MTLLDLFFLASVLFTLVLALLLTVRAIRGQRSGAYRTARVLGLFVACYLLVLGTVSLVKPRGIYAPGERRCYDDWCVAVLTAQPLPESSASPCPAAAAARIWTVDVQVSSVARRARQSAPDARAELEDRSGRRYVPCAALSSPPGTAHALTGSLGPGESFRVSLPFALPPAADPAGLVLHHGDFPGLLIIGEDSSILHTPALHRLAFRRNL